MTVKKEPEEASFFVAPKKVFIQLNYTVGLCIL